MRRFRALCFDTRRARTRPRAVVLEPALAERRARQSVERQLDRDDLRGVEVRVDATSVTVELEGVVDLTLLRLVRGADPFTVRVTSTARPYLPG
jgi:prophage tail gpP-like protein